MITPRKSRKNQAIQPQVITGCMIAASLAKRIISRAVTDYFRFNLGELLILIEFTGFLLSG
jgi:hypothetical protein